MFGNGGINNGKPDFEKYAAWQAECEARFQQLKKNEEELNRIFIDIYGLQDELTPDVADKDVTVHRVFDSKDDVPESMKGSNYVRTMRDEIVSSSPTPWAVCSGGILWMWTGLCLPEEISMKILSLDGHAWRQGKRSHK